LANPTSGEAARSHCLWQEVATPVRRWSEPAHRQAPCPLWRGQEGEVVGIGPPERHMAVPSRGQGQDRVGVRGPTAPLTGPAALDFGALARIAAEVTGRQIRQEVLTDAELRAQAGARAAGSGRGSYNFAPGGVLPAADHAGPDFSRLDRLDRVASDQVQGRYALVQGDEGERPHVQRRAKPAGMGRHGKATKAEKAFG
jgi:hypothetical protein